MIKTVYNSETVFILNDYPSFGLGFKTDFESIVDTQAGLSTREERRAFSGTLRSTINAFSVVQGSALRDIQGRLKELKDAPVLMPFWPALSFWSDRATMKIIGATQIVFKTDWSAYSIYEVGVTTPSFGPANGDYIVPLLRGFIDPQKISVKSQELAVFNIRFEESSDATWALGFDGTALTDGPTPTGYGSAPPVLPFTPNYKSTQDMIDVKVTREKMGFGREQRTVFYLQESSRSQQSAYTLNGKQSVADLLAFFAGDAGQGGSFWAPSSLAVGKASAATVAGATTIGFQDVGGVAAGDYIAVRSGAGAAVAWAKIATIIGNNVNVVAAFGVALDAGQQIYALALSRLDGGKLSVDWKSPVLATASFSWREVRPEQTIPADETIGTTIGQLNPRCYLYEFSRMLNGNLVVDRLTSYELEVFAGGNTYNPIRIEHGEIRQGIALDSDSIEIDVDNFAGNPLLDAALMRMEVPVTVTVKTADLGALGVGFINAAGIATIFSGEVVKASVRGSRIAGTAVPGGSIFDRMVPRVRFQLGCNNCVFDQGCGLDPALWSYTGKVHTDYVNGTYQLILDTVAPTSIAHTVTANWFALGWVELLLAGTTTGWQARPILASTTIVAGALTITVDRDFYPQPLSARVTGGGPLPDAVRLFPGCDGSYGSSCVGKFNNGINFLGHPFLPLSNPSVVKSNPSASGGKK